MTTDPTDLATPTGKLTRAAVLLDAVARYSEQAVDFDVPLRCGHAAGLLHTALQAVPTQIPFVADDVNEIAAAIHEALTLLASLPDEEITDPILDAILDARAATDALPQVM